MDNINQLLNQLFNPLERESIESDVALSVGGIIVEKIRAVLGPDHDSFLDMLAHEKVDEAKKLLILKGIYFLQIFKEEIIKSGDVLAKSISEKVDTLQWSKIYAISLKGNYQIVILI